jgi:hypothetical protein
MSDEIPPKATPKMNLFLKLMDRLRSISAHREDRVDYFAFLDLLQQIPAGAKQAEWDKVLKHARVMFDLDEGSSGLCNIYYELFDLGLPLTRVQYEGLERFGRRWGFHATHWEDLLPHVK